MTEKLILSKIRSADHDFSMIEDGDRVLVGVSGGKDSLTLLKLLKTYQRFPTKNFTYFGVFLDLGFNNTDISALLEFVKKEEIEFYIEDQTQVYKILKQHLSNNGRLPCSICSRMKKASINQAAHKYKATKVAFAHHVDDALETLLMNEIHGGRVATFEPKMYLSREDITFIRPLAYCKESEIIEYSNEFELPIIKGLCENDKHTEREVMKDLLSSIYDKFPTAHESFITMLRNKTQFQLWFKDETTYSKDIIIKEAYLKEDAYYCYYIRAIVFVEEQKFSISEEFDPRDLVSTNFILYYQKKPAATIRYFIKDGAFYLGRFAVLKEFRHKGLGELLFKAVEQIITTKNNPVDIYFNGQSYLKEFYLRMGYEIIGDEFEETNIPHYKFHQHFAHPRIYFKK